MTDTSPPPRADHPRVPRPGRSIFGIVMAGVGALVVGGYLYMAVTQRELGDTDRDEIPASVRTSPGGYRSYTFWHSGYHGGK
jgi:hypothetical protein